jgi:hypothetical protein
MWNVFYNALGYGNGTLRMKLVSLKAEILELAFLFSAVCQVCT